MLHQSYIWKGLILQKPDQGTEQIRDHQTPDKRTEYSDQRRKSLFKQIKIVQRHIEYRGGGNHAESRDAPVQIFFIPMEMTSHSPLLSGTLSRLRLIYILYAASRAVKRQRMFFPVSLQLDILL